MTWPVPWIEQAVYYQQLVETLAQYRAQHTPISVHSFSEPTQTQWENAYQAQSGLIPPILPGSRLMWHDLKNGSVKPYTTVYGPNGTDIDSTVRPLINDIDPQGCLRYLGRRRTYGGSLFYGHNTDVRYDAYGIFFDLQYLIDRGLVSLIVQYKSFSPVLISLHGEVATADVASQWGRTDQAFGYSLERAAASATSTYRVVGGGSTPVSDIYYVLASYNSGSTAPVLTETNYGYAMIFSAATSNYGTNYVGLAAALTAQATPLRMWQSYGVKYDGSGVRDLRIGTPTSRGILTETAYLYGIFASDPGRIEVFDV